MERIVIVVKGGMVNEVYSSSKFVDVEVINQDSEYCPILTDLDIPEHLVLLRL